MVMRSESFDIAQALEPVQRGLTLAHVERASLRGLGVGACLGTLNLVLARGVYIPHPVPVTVALVALSLAASALGALLRPASPLEAARWADRHFFLRDRLTTALEYRHALDPLATLQRVDVLRQMAPLDLRESRRPHFSRREVGAVLTSVLVVIVLTIFSGGSGTQRPEQSSNERPRIQLASARLPSITRSLDSGLTAQEQRAPLLRRFRLALAGLQRQLLHASSRAVALRAVSATQLQLQRLASSLHPVDHQQVARLASSLRPYGAGNRGPSSAPRPSAASAAGALQRLAHGAQQLTPSARADLQRALQRAASATSDWALGAALRRAAKALQRNDPASAASALQSAASALQHGAVQEAVRSAVNAANGQLDSLKNDISGLSGVPQSQLASTVPGSPRDQISGRSAGRESKGGLLASRQGHAGAAPGTGASGSAGQSRGGGRKTGDGQPAGQSAGGGRQGGGGRGAGQGRPGGHGSGGSRSSAAAQRQGRFVTVYVPAVPGSGPRTSQTAPGDVQQQPRFLPYQTVIARYRESARMALDHGALPPSLQTYVRRYFAAISR